MSVLVGKQRAGWFLKMFRVRDLAPVRERTGTAGPSPEVVRVCCEDPGPLWLLLLFVWVTAGFLPGLEGRFLWVSARGSRWPVPGDTYEIPGQPCTGQVAHRRKGWGELRTSRERRGMPVSGGLGIVAYN